MDSAGLEGVALFAGLSTKQREQVARHADEVELGEGAVLAEEGRLATEFFVITSGTADVFEGEKRVASLGPGDFVGEIGVLKTHKRTATVVATSPVEAIVMYGPELVALQESMPDVFQVLEAAARERLERSAGD